MKNHSTPGVDIRVVGRISAAQNMLFVLPTENKITEFYAQLLSAVPGVRSCRMCLGLSFSQNNETDNEPCSKCEYIGCRDDEVVSNSKIIKCKLDKIPGSYVFPVKTLDRCFGFIFFLVDQEGSFDPYKPFIKNLGSFIALSLENRLQKKNLLAANELLDVKVKKRTEELQFTNVCLKKEIEDRRQAEDALGESEKRYRQLLASVTDYIYSVLVRDGHPVATVHGPGCASVTGYAPEDYAADPDLWYRMIYHEDRPSVVRQAESILEGESPLPLEHRITHRDGSTRWVRLTSVPRHDLQGRLIAYDGLIQDITERKRNDAVNMSRLHLIRFAETHSLDELLEETLNEVEKITGSLIGFFHFVKDNQKSLTLQNWSTRTKSEFCKAEGKGLHYPIAEAGVWVDCVYQRKPVIHNDYVSLPHRKGMPKGHAEVIRELVVPVLRGEKITAILGVGNKPTGYDNKDVETVSLMADLAWEISERKKAEEALRKRNEELERFERAVIGRELKMIELKKRIAELEEKNHA